MIGDRHQLAPRFAVGLFVVVSLGAFDQGDIIGTASVIDGDTIEIHGQRIRLHGIDAPESRQSCFDEGGRPWHCGQQSALALADYIGRAPVSCRAIDSDRYGRIVAKCAVRGADIQQWLAQTCWAFAFRRYSTDYIAAEAIARDARRGVWRGPTQPPWEWRRQGAHE